MTDPIENHPTINASGMSCGEVSALVPWMVNGSLDEAERAALLLHLRSCESCRDELSAVREAAGLYSTHVPSMTLAEHCLGVEIGAEARTRVEAHLEICASCREEADLIRSESRIVDFEARKAERRLAKRTSQWRRLGVAAAVAASLAAVIWTAGPSLRAPRPEPAMLAGDAASAAEELLFSESFESGALAIRSSSLFGDGFESGDLSGWSRTAAVDEKTSG